MPLRPCLRALRSDDVAQRVVLLVQGEQAGVRDFGVLADADLFLPFEQQERLESGRRVHLTCSLMLLLLLPLNFIVGWQTTEWCITASNWCGVGTGASLKKTQTPIR